MGGIGRVEVLSGGVIGGLWRVCERLRAGVGRS